MKLLVFLGSLILLYDAGVYPQCEELADDELLGCLWETHQFPEAGLPGDWFEGVEDEDEDEADGGNDDA